MQHSAYNWYSTNSRKRYQKTVSPPRLAQYSDEGRIPLGRSNDPESIELRKQLLDSVSEATLQDWEDFRKEMREKSLLGKRQLGSRVEEAEEKFRTYPAKKHSYETDGVGVYSDASYHRREPFDRSRYVLNRRVNPRQAVSSSFLSPKCATAPVSDNDEIFVDDRETTASTSRWVVSGDETSIQIKPKHMRIIAPILVPAKNHRSEATTTTNAKEPQFAWSSPSSSTTNSGSRPPSVRECSLYRSGHCMCPKTCPLAHDGVVQKNENDNISYPTWPKRLPTTKICPGYANLTCWKMSCELRHVVYISDNL